MLVSKFYVLFRSRRPCGRGCVAAYFCRVFKVAAGAAARRSERWSVIIIVVVTAIGFNMVELKSIRLCIYKCV